MEGQVQDGSMRKPSMSNDHNVLDQRSTGGQISGRSFDVAVNWRANNCVWVATGPFYSVRKIMVEGEEACLFFASFPYCFVLCFVLFFGVKEEEERFFFAHSFSLLPPCFFFFPAPPLLLFLTHLTLHRLPESCASILRTLGFR